jgi:enterochelin esterase family protein
MNASTTSPTLGHRDVTFEVSDPAGELEGVNLYQEVRRPRLGPPFIRDPGGGRWRLTFPRAEIDRMEYMVELVRADNSIEWTADPGNPLRAPGPFGDKSVVEWPSYEPPGWLTDDLSLPGHILGGTVDCPPIGASLPVLLWSSHRTRDDEPLPLLVAHDGPEYGRYSKLMTLLDHATSQRRLPPMRAALIGPVDRDEIYSASAAYGRTLAHDVLPWLNRHAPTPQGRRFRVGMGASLGALAMLHAHRTHPASFGALYLQSGSFFRQRFDKHESGFPRFRRISRFVGRVLAADDWSHPIPVTMSCGTIEENLANNRAVCEALERQGYDVRLATFRDGHNWVGWRDNFDPHLVDLLRRTWA